MKYEVKSNISILERGIMLEFVNIFVVGNGDGDGDVATLSAKCELERGFFNIYLQDNN